MSAHVIRGMLESMTHTRLHSTTPIPPAPSPRADVSHSPQPAQGTTATACAAAPVVLQAQNVTKSFGETVALRGVSVAIRAGESVAVMGPSGSGKTTLMHVLSGIVSADSGETWFNGQAGHSGRLGQGRVALSTLTEDQRAELRRQSIGFVFQEGLLLPELTARENVAVALMISGVPRRSAEAEADQWLARLGLAGMEERRPAQLSGGQAQRVAIARAQVTQPSVVFADEPTGALDSVTSQQVLSALHESTISRGAPLVTVTHDETVASRCSRLIRLQDGEVVYDSAQAPAPERASGAAPGAARGASGEPWHASTPGAGA